LRNRTVCMQSFKCISRKDRKSNVQRPQSRAFKSAIAFANAESHSRPFK
jgi:hypothetical protein